MGEIIDINYFSFLSNDIIQDNSEAYEAYA